MSWSVSPGKAVKAADVVKELKAAQAKQLELAPFDSFDDDIETDMQTAISIAGEIAGDLGEEYVIVTVSGHRRRGATDPTSMNVSVYGGAKPA